MSGVHDGWEDGVGERSDAEVLPAYEIEPGRDTMSSTVLRMDRDQRGLYVVLNDTLFYPEGGGQPADQGRLDGWTVTVVLNAGGEVRHYLSLRENGTDEVSAPATGDTVTLVLDRVRRMDHMQQHSAQHLLSAIAQDRFGWPTTAFHLGTEVSDVELQVPALSATDLRNLEEAVAQQIRAALPIRSWRVSPEDLAGLTVRSRGLPQGHRGRVRLVAIEGVDLSTCGGTHCSNTAEIEGLALLDLEPMRGGLRLRWVAGARLRRRLAEQERRSEALRRVLRAPDEALVDSAERLQAALRERDARLDLITERLADALVREALAQTGDLVSLHDAGLDRDLQRRVGKRLLAAGRAALLSGGAPPEAAWLLVLPPGHPAVAAVADGLADLASLLGGRGGGRAPFFQGQAASWAALPAAEAWLRARIVERS